MLSYLVTINLRLHSIDLHAPGQAIIHPYTRLSHNIWQLNYNYNTIRVEHCNFSRNLSKMACDTVNGRGVYVYMVVYCASLNGVHTT